MKPFNLDEYLKNPDRKVITRDGHSVKIYCTNYDSRQPIIAEVEGHNFSRSFTEYGRYYISDRNSPYDLFFAPEKHEGWMNIYRDLKINELYCRYIFPSEEEAKRNATSDTIATVKIEWEE